MRYVVATLVLVSLSCKIGGLQSEEQAIEKAKLEMSDDQKELIPYAENFSYWLAQTEGKGVNARTLSAVFDRIKDINYKDPKLAVKDEALSGWKAVRDTAGGWSVTYSAVARNVASGKAYGIVWTWDMSSDGKWVRSRGDFPMLKKTFAEGAGK